MPTDAVLTATFHADVATRDDVQVPAGIDWEVPNDFWVLRYGQTRIPLEAKEFGEYYVIAYLYENDADMAARRISRKFGISSPLRPSHETMDTLKEALDPHANKAKGVLFLSIDPTTILGSKFFADVS